MNLVTQTDRARRKGKASTMRTWLLVLVTLCLGCATYWEKPGANEQDFAQDKYRCSQESERSWMAWGNEMQVMNAQMAAQNQANQMWTMCMEAHGWRKTKKSND